MAEMASAEDKSSVLDMSPFVQLHPKNKPTQKRSLEDPEDWDDLSSYMVLKRRKLQSQFDAMHGGGKSVKSTIFEGVTIYVNGWTQPSAGELKEMIYEHGGKYEYNMYSRSQVTHTIASNLPNAKILNLGQSIVCRPDWIVDSIAVNKKLPVEKYLLYEAQDGQTKLKFSKQVKSENDSTKSTENKDFITDCMSSADENDSAENKSTTTSTTSSKRTDFVKEFFTHSRLHYLSTWSMELKQFMADMLKRVSPKIPKLPASASLRASKTRAVVHIDLDCFFVSVSIRTKPQLKGKPVAVTHAKKTSSEPSFSFDPDDSPNLSSRKDSASGDSTISLPSLPSAHDSAIGEAPGMHPSGTHQKIRDSTSDIASCSYEARKFGISNGMSVGAAVKKCPDLILLPYDFEAYRDVSQKFYAIMLQYSSVIEAVSCDEAYVELTDYCRNFEHVSEIVCELREVVAKQTGCTVSAGISHNMLLARMSTRVAKPDGQFLLSPDQVEHFLSCQNVHDLPGVGYSTAAKIQDIGIKNCGELSSVPVNRLQAMFGSKIGKTLHDYARGMDDRELKLTTERKSVSVDINFGIRFKEISEAELLLGNLAEELQCRAEEAGVSGTQITLKMKIRKQSAPRETKKYLGHGACDNVSRSMALLQATREASECSRLAVKLLRQVRPAAEDVRGMGLQLSKLVSHSGDGGGGAQGQLLKFFKTAPRPKEERELPGDNPAPLTQHQPHHQQHFPGMVQSPSNSKAQRKRQTAATSAAASSKHSPIKQSPSKSLHSPAKSPAKSLRDYFKSSSNTHDSTASGTTAPSTGVSSTAAVATIAARSSYTAARNLDESFVVDLPPVSQLDHGVLDALPPQLREKIVEGYNKRGQAMAQIVPKKERITVGEDEEFTNMVMSSSKGGMGGTTSQSGSGGFCEPTRGGEDNGENEKELRHKSEAEEEEVVISNEDHFLEDWKSDIREWVDLFCDGPTDDDVLAVASHFCRLANTNLKMVEVCLKIFRRFLVSRGLVVWCPCFNFLLEQIQGRVKIVYGGTLKVEELVLGVTS